MKLRLGQLLLQAGVCSREDLVEAWEQKVLFGDRLGTNLLGLAAVDERTLAQALGHQHGVPAAYGEVLRVEKSAVSLLPRVLCEERSILPHHKDGQRLFLLMRDPDDLPTRKEVASLTGLEVVPVVVCEARMWQLAGRLLGGLGGLRPVPLDEDAVAAQARRRADRTQRTTGPISSGPELVSEEDFQALYVQQATAPVELTELEELEEQVDRPLDLGRALEAAERSHPRTSPAGDLPPETFLSDDGETTLDGLARPEQELSLRDESVISVEPVPGESASAEVDPALAPATTSSGKFRVELPRGFLVGDPLPLPSALDAPARGADPLPMARAARGSAAAGPATFEPLTFDEAGPLLDAADGREEIASIVLRAALSRFRRAALLTVYPGRVAGWRGAPEAFHAAMRRLHIDRNAKTLFSLVISSRAHYIGPLQKWKAHAEWVKQTGRAVPRSVVVLPILVRERVVNLLYCDNGHDAHADPDVGELLILGQRIAQSYEGLLDAGRAASARPR